MRFQASFASWMAALAALVVFGGVSGHAQSSSSTQSPQIEPTQPAPAPAYVVIDPLANVRYDNRYDVSLGAAYGHLKAGPPPLQQGANLGGLDFDASYWLTKHWGLEGTGRAYVGTSGAAVNAFNIEGPFVSEYIFAGGGEWLGPHNKHGAFLAHAMVGGAHGIFEHDLRGHSPETVEFFNDQTGLAAVIGGHIDLNRTPRWVLRITPDAKYTRYSIDYGNRDTYGYWNFALSVGVEYKFKKKR